MDIYTSFLGDNFNPEFGETPISRPVRSKVVGIGSEKAVEKTGVRKRRGRPKKDNGRDLPVDHPQVAVSPEDRKKANNIIDEIGKRFSENRKISQSAAYECYQKDLSDNSAYLVNGGVMTMKELSEMLMKLEEFRKRTTETGKTPATLLAEWLRGENIPSA